MRTALDDAFSFWAVRRGAIGSFFARMAKARHPCEGMDRRRHQRFVTRHTEYHLRADECVGVRDLATGRWLRHHPALRLKLLRRPPGEVPEQWVGQRLQFWGATIDVLTSPVVEVSRPEKTAVGHYISQSVAGEIAAAA